MSDILLKELSNSDINWIKTVGDRIKVAREQVLIDEQETVNCLYILMSGALAVTVSGEQDVLENAFEALENRRSSDREITRLSEGEIIGKIPLLNIWQTGTTVKAVDNSAIISIPESELQIKLKQDVNFALRFYRAITVLFADKIKNTINRSEFSHIAQSQPLKESLIIFNSGLYDSDIDWLIKAGRKQEVPANKILINQLGAVDTFSFLLDGMISLSAGSQEPNPLEIAFAAIEDKEVTSQQITKLSKGGIIGETLLTNSRLPSTTAKTIKDSVILSIDRRVLLGKLEQDIGFAARFYRQIATVLIYRLQKLHSKLSSSRRVYSEVEELTSEDGDEIDIYSLDEISFASQRFNWILRQLNVD